MRKIETREDRDKKKKRNQIIIGSLLVLIMIFSVLGYAFYNTKGGITRKIQYNGIEFILNEQGFWVFELGNYEFLIQYNPEDTENISVPFLDMNNYAGMPLFFVSKNNFAVSEVARNLEDFVLRMQNVCLQGEECLSDLPIKNCSENIIIIKEGEEGIFQEENCIFISSSYEEQVRTTDAFVFKILGVKD